jgi:prevent-host-death family protein
MAAIFDMQEGISLTDARPILTQLPERLAEGQGVVPLTRHGKPVLAIMTWDLFEAWSETIEIMSDSDLMKQLLESMKQIDLGKTRPWEEVKAELDL